MVAAFAHRPLRRRAALICAWSLCGALACVPALPAECDSCAYVAALIQDPASLGESPTTAPTTANQGQACSLNAGAGTISDSETGFAITSAPNAAQPDRATSIVADYDAIYVGGFEGVSGVDFAWRIEKRDRVTGTLIPAFGTGGAVTSNPSAFIDRANDMALDSSGLYIFGEDRTPGAANGQWRLEKRDRTTGALIPTFGTGGVVTQDISANQDFGFAIAIDANAIYLAGSYSTGGAAQAWRIEKRNLTTGALVTAFNGTGFVNVPAGGNLISRANAIAVDANFLYVGGASFAGNGQWRLEKRNLNDGALVPAFDGDGRVEVNPGPGGDQIFSVSVNGGAVFTAGGDTTPSGRIRVEKRDLVTGALLPAFDTDGILSLDPSGGGDGVSAVVVDGADLYFAGFDRVLGNDQIAVYRYDQVAGTPIAAFDTDGVLQINPSTGNDLADDMCVDSAFVYTVGAVGSGTAQDWYILKRNRVTGL